jgi:hypothetical protein
MVMTTLDYKYKNWLTIDIQTEQEKAKRARAEFDERTARPGLLTKRE